MLDVVLPFFLISVMFRVHFFFIVFNLPSMFNDYLNHSNLQRQHISISEGEHGACE
jgi:hypothetical protein